MSAFRTAYGTCLVRLTPSAPHATAELQGEITLLLQELGPNLAQWDALDADILSGGVARRIVLLVQARCPDGIRGGQGGDDGVFGGEIRSPSSCAQEADSHGPPHGSKDEAHGDDGRGVAYKAKGGDGMKTQKKTKKVATPRGPEDGARFWWRMNSDR